jgi:hypothetical protein
MRSWLIVTLVAAAASAQPGGPSYGDLREGQTIHGFQATAVYLDDAEHAIGARFRHVRSGFTLDLLQIQSVPQTFIWVTTYPSSNMGEPHTQEHLLLGKGNKGQSARLKSERWRGSPFFIRIPCVYYTQGESHAAIP